MARLTGVSISSAQRIWKAHGPQPHRLRSFKRSHDTDFASKLDDVVGLYTDTAANAVVLICRAVRDAGARPMIGERRVDQGALFYEFSLERHVPPEHLLRAIDRFLDFDGLRTSLAPFYGTTGRPSLDSELLIRLLIVGYCFGIRPERLLCEEVHLNLAYRWFCRLGLDGGVPDHSTSRRTAMAVSATEICCGDCSKRFYEVVWMRAWLAAKALPLMPA